ncbi:hypothetical protein ACLKA6_006615 [Drosophila palustris]
MFSATVLILFANLALAESRILVPSVSVKIDDHNQFKLESSDDQYTLTADHDSGYLNEKVEEIAPGQLQVNGEYKQTFVGPKPVHLLVIYEAGRNGYMAKYRIWNMESLSVKLPANFLKSSAG